MIKKNIGRGFSVYPMPVAIVGAVVEGEPNFMTAAWLTKLGYEPAMIGVSMGTKQHTAKGIRENGMFGVSFPSVDQAVLADYCGLVHGYQEDKSAHIDIFRGGLESAPMVRQCPLTMEFRLTQTVELPKNYFFIGECAAAYASESILTEGQIDLAKFRPIVLTMPDNSYWTLGERVGDAWGIGKVMLQTKS